MRTNYHSHTWRCKHAQGTEEEMVRAALKSGFTDLGFSDHAPWPFPDGFVSGCRMHAEQLPDYVATIQGLREQYKGQIRIYIGLEAEYYPSMMGWMREMKEQYGLYLIMGDHFEDEPGFYFGSCANRGEMNRYLDRVIAGLETGLYTYLAHPDLFMRRWPHGFTEDCRRAAEDLCAACLELGVPMEYNVHMRYSMGPDSGYPCAPFFEIVRDRGVPVLVGLDAHAPEEIAQPEQWQTACREMEALGIPRLEMPELRGFTGRQ